MTPKHYSPTPDLAGGSAPVDSQGDKEYILDSMTKRVWLKSECDESMLIGFPNRYVQVFLSDAALQGTGGGMTGFDSKRFYEYMRKNDFAWSKDVESEQEWCDAVDLYFTLLKDESPNDQAPAQGQAVDAEGWIELDKSEPNEEGKYLCACFYNLESIGESFIQFVAKFELMRMRETGEKYIGQDGETGCFMNDSGRGCKVTHWRKLPNPPQV